MPLEWSDVQEPNADIRYTHVVAKTPLGRIVLDWKGWKDYSSPVGEMPWGEHISGIDLDDAKQKAQAAWDRMIPALLPLCSDPLLSK